MPLPKSRRRPAAILFAEQMRVVGFALIREGALAGTAFALICILTLIMTLRDGDHFNLEPVVLEPILLVAILLPFAVWKGDPVFGRAFLWTLPVRRQYAAVAKMLAGAVWLMLAMLAAFVSLALVALATGGSIGIQEERVVATASGGMAKLVWTTPPWIWLAPFAGALILYFLSSAALIGLRHPIRWLAGFLVALALLLGLAVSLAPQSAVEQALDQIRLTLWSGNYGFSFVMTGGEDTLARSIDRLDMISWRGMPEIGRWAMAALVWFGAALIALAFAFRRHWER